MTAILAPTAAPLRARVPSMAPTLTAARQLARELRELGMPAVVNGDGDVALISVWRGLWITCLYLQGRLWLRWWTGRTSAETGRCVYAHHDPADPRTAARRISHRFFEVREDYPDGDLLRGPDSGLRWRL